ncbi:Uncharacterised protein [Citrobacter koseri]|uniref:Uncharacterized protein n=1 Tax=Citrobacter koseri TaxID=545 RepID=A0A2X2UY52_CITKO|nr:Uncharacterised protein [Citrobacter koseri]
MLLVQASDGGAQQSQGKYAAFMRVNAGSGAKHVGFAGHT